MAGSTQIGAQIGAQIGGKIAGWIILTALASGCAPQSIPASKGSAFGVNTQFPQAASEGGDGAGFTLNGVVSPGDYSFSRVGMKSAAKKKDSVQGMSQSMRDLLPVPLGDDNPWTRDWRDHPAVAGRIYTYRPDGEPVREANFGSVRGDLGDPAQSATLTRDREGARETIEIPLQFPLSGTSTLAQISSTQALLTDGKRAYIINARSSAVTASFNNLGAVSSGKVAVSVVKDSTVRLGRTDASGKLTSVTELNTVTGQTKSVALAESGF